MFAGGAAGAAAPPRPAPPRAAPAPAARAGGGPSGTTTALVIVASASFRVVRFSHGAVAAAAAPRSIKTMLSIMVVSSSEALRYAGHAITQVDLIQSSKGS